MRTKRARRDKIKLLTHKSLQKNYDIDDALADKAMLWVVRILIRLNGLKSFIDNEGFVSKDLLFEFVQGMRFALDGEYNKEKALEVLGRDLKKLESKKKLKGHKLLSKNIAQISKLMDLNRYEEQVLEFVVLINQFDLLQEALDLLGSDLNSSQCKRALSIILNIPKKHIEAIFSSHSKFSRSSLVVISKGFTGGLMRKLDSISDSFLDNLFSLDDDISVMLKESIIACSKSRLTLEDYKHIDKDIAILVPYLEYALQSNQSGVNILLYGKPGTGKTELAKVLAEKLEAELFEVSYIDENDDPIDGRKRLNAYKSAQALLGNKEVLLMYDEAEDVFEQKESIFFGKSRQKDKAWLNRILERNTIPTIWITNNIYVIDDALIRRFDMSIEVPIPAKSKRKEIIKNYSLDLLDEKSIMQLSEHKNIAPALVASVAKVISSIETKNSSEAFTHLLNNTLKAQGYQEVKEQRIDIDWIRVYDPRLIHTTANIEELTEGIVNAKSARICLYGVPGTGKSAFAKFIAFAREKPLMIKKGSDLISKWVGETEENIANAFREAKEEDAVLVFDEVDSFLAERAEAKQSWQVTQVNEMLVQMEEFDGVFIATTNLIDNLDKASLRRFDLKLEFFALKPKQAWKMFKKYLKLLKLPKADQNDKKAFMDFEHLTPGDFAAVFRQSRFRPIADKEAFIDRLKSEVEIKNIHSEKRLGFL